MDLSSCSIQPQPFQILVVFHKFLVDECYETLSDNDIQRHLRFIAVNAKIPKTVPIKLIPQITHERDLPWYNPFLQHNRFCESSVFYHAWKNPSFFLESNEYIGFVHYDMLVQKECLEYLNKEIASARANNTQVLFVHRSMEARQHLQQLFSLNGWNKIINIYNSIFSTSHTICDVIDEEIPLYHTFVLHRDTFQRLMFFAECAIPYLFEMIGFDTKHLPFKIERMHGIFLALQVLDGKIPPWLPMPGIVHLDRLKDDWKPLPVATGPGGAV